MKKSIKIFFTSILCCSALLTVNNSFAVSVNGYVYNYTSNAILALPDPMSDDAAKCMTFNNQPVNATTEYTLEKGDRMPYTINNLPADEVIAINLCSNTGGCSVISCTFYIQGNQSKWTMVQPTDAKCIVNNNDLYIEDQ
jgi:hypothetical protein